MICHLGQIINSIPEDFWKISLKDVFGMILNSVRTRKGRFYIPSSERYCAADYTFWGTYTRKQIIDIQLVPCEDGKNEYKQVIIEDYHIQRIMDNRTGATHAVLNEFLVPYKQYTCRYILYYLFQFFSQYVGQEEYCLTEGIEPKTFTCWLKWLKDHITLLFGVGLMKDYKDNWEAMAKWIQEIKGNISLWAFNSLRKLNLALFQERKMPENTKYQNYERTG